MIKKMKDCFTNNLILSVALVIFGIIVACLAWKYTLHIATGAVPAINQMNEQIVYETDCAKNTSEEIGLSIPNLALYTMPPRVLM